MPCLLHPLGRNTSTHLTGWVGHRASLAVWRREKSLASARIWNPSSSPWHNHYSDYSYGFCSIAVTVRKIAKFEHHTTYLWTHSGLHVVWELPGFFFWLTVAHGENRLLVLWMFGGGPIQHSVLQCIHISWTRFVWHWTIPFLLC